MKKTKIIRVAFAFARYDKIQLNYFALLVVACLRNNALFPLLPVSVADLEGLQQTYVAAMNNAPLRGLPARAAFREAREALILALRQIGAYVQSLGLTKESDVMSSGFDLAVWNTRQTPLTTPVLVRLDNSVSTQLALKLRAVANAKVYEVQFSADGGQTWLAWDISPTTKGIVLTGLTTGTVYSVRVRAVGGSTRFSAWSNVLSRMAV
jgi:hypothetical protein